MSRESAKSALEEKLREIIPTAVVTTDGGRSIARITLKQTSIALPIYTNQSISGSSKIG